MRDCIVRSIANILIFGYQIIRFSQEWRPDLFINIQLLPHFLILAVKFFRHLPTEKW